MTDTTVRARVRPTAARRWVALVMMFGLGALLIYVALSSPPEHPGWLVFLLVAGAGALVMGERMRRATLHAVELTEDAVVDTAGRVLCRLDEVEGIDRGMFAFKPSNGFVLRLRAPAQRHWAPGLWWRLGRRVGIGGVTPAVESKFMAEMIAVQLEQRDRGQGD